jgi:alpha-beta hydrolase superfamily lysophospholipase
MWHPDRRFEIPLNEPELFTANPERQQFISEDPLRLRETGAGFLAASRWMDAAKRRLKRAGSCPLHVFLAEYDRIIDNQATRQWVRRLGWNRSKVTVYQGAHHTLEFEPDPRPFFEDLAECLERAD